MVDNLCRFTGHSTLPPKKIERIITNLDREIKSLIAKGVTNFISGGALGFGQIAASLIITKKEMGKAIHLIFALPRKNQDESWAHQQKERYRALLLEADEIVYVSEEYTADCMKKRNYYMIDNAHFAYALYKTKQAEQGKLFALPKERPQSYQCSKMKGVRLPDYR